MHPTKTHYDAHIFNLSLPFNPLFVKAAVVHAGTPLTVAAVIRSSPPEARARRPAIPALLPPASGRARDQLVRSLTLPNFIESSIDLLTTKKSREH